MSFCNEWKLKHENQIEHFLISDISMEIVRMR